MKVNKMLYHDENITVKQSKEMLMDVSVAAITKDTGAGKLNDIKPGTSIVAVSYAAAMKNILANERDDLESLMKKLPAPTPIDEVKIMETEEQKKQHENKQSAESKPVDWVRVLWVGLAVIGGFVLLLLLLPWLIWQYLNFKAKQQNSPGTRAYHSYHAVMYYLNQLGKVRKNQSPQQFALEIDKTINTNFYKFTNIYQKIKYSNLPLTATEIETTEQFYQSFMKQVKVWIPWQKRIAGFLNIYHTVHYFTKEKIN